MMRTAIFIVLLAGLLSSAISGGSETTSKTNWDDDSMILPSISATSASAVATEGRVNKETTTQQRPRFISLIPSGHHEIPQTTTQPQDISRGTFYQTEPAKAAPSEQNSPEQEDSSTPSTAEDDGSASVELTTETPKLRFIQLGKVPLTVEVLPLLQPEQDRVFGRQNEKPVGFFPEQTGEPMWEKTKILRREQEKQQRQRSTEDLGTRQGDSGELLPEPLTYMVPPRKDAPDYWRQYPLQYEAATGSLLSNHPATTESIEEVTATTTPINPVLERLRSFLQKAKRHSIEQQGNKDQTQEDDLQGVVDTTLEDDSTSSTTTTTEDLESGDQFMTTSPAPLAPPLEEVPATTTFTLPRPQVPQVFNYQREPQQPLAYGYGNIVTAPPSLDQFFSDYSVNNNVLDEQRNQYYYSNSNPNRVKMLSLSLKPPVAPLYTSGDSYWPRKYFYGSDAGVNNLDYPFIRYNDYYRPPRNNRLVYPTPSLLGSINEQQQKPYYGSVGYDRYGYNNEQANYGNIYPQNFNRGFPNQYSYPSPSSYVMNYHPMIPYNNRPFYSSSPVVNNLMYAPLYPYEQFNRRIQSPQQEFF